MTDKLLIVLEVDGETQRVPEVIEKLRAHINTGEVMVRGYDRGYVAIGPDAELVLDVFAEPELGGGRHVADIGPNGWVIEHSLICRRSGQMTECPYIEHMRDAMAELDELWEPGRWVLEIQRQVGFTTPEHLKLTPEAEYDGG